ncbi:MAG TPA: hypothetical protein VIH70_01560, partial [Actinomycetota bacterium]
MTAEPRRVGRHRHLDLVGEDPRERGHVGTFEGAQVAMEDRAFLTGRRADGSSLVVPSSDARSPALQRAVDRRGRRAEELRDLGRAPLEHVSKKQDRALPRRQHVDRGEERELDRFPARESSRGILELVQEPVRVRLEPDGLEDGFA